MCPGASSIVTGSTTSHRPLMNRWQRVWNTQPAGGLAGLGISPAERDSRRLTSPSTLGTADSSASVYGWLGPSKICSVVPELHDPAEVHHGDPVAEVAHDAEVVRDEQVARAVAGLEVGEHVEDRRLHRDVEGARRLVADDDARVAGEGAGDGDALLEATRQLARLEVEVTLARAAATRRARRPAVGLGALAAR